MRILNYQYLTKVVHYLQKTLAITTGYSTLQWKQWVPMYWYGECSCLRQWKQPFIFDQITLRIWIESHDIDWTRKGNDEICGSNSQKQDIREEIPVGTLDVPRSWKCNEVVWKRKVSSWWKVGLVNVSDGTANQGNRSPSLYKCQCIESWNSENAERKRNHTLQCWGFKHRTLVPNHSFFKLAQYVRSSFE